MDEKEFDKYLKERYHPQVDWYDKKSISNQKAYKFLQWSIIILAAITPIFVILSETWGLHIPVVLSCLVAIGSASLKTFKFQENWINYRTTCETLRKEIYFYNARVDDYSSNDPTGVFVKRVESLISRENTMWLTVQEQKESKD